MEIYLITNKIDGKQYVGKTIRTTTDRWREHSKKSGRCPYLHNAIQTHGKENFTVETIDGANSFSELNYLESHYIFIYNTMAPNGYNLTSGGENYTVSEDTRKKMSISLTGRIFSEEHIENLRIAGLARVQTEETKQKISLSTTGEKNPFYGKRHTKESIEKANKGRQKYYEEKYRKVVCIETGIIFTTASEACRQMGLDDGTMSLVLRGKLKHTKGYTFKYYEPL